MTHCKIEALKNVSFSLLYHSDAQNDTIKLRTHACALVHPGVIASLHTHTQNRYNAGLFFFQFI